ncbi:hypothetical protein CFIMG_008511RA00001 [Ceratocystis fimbriata CBS 114723]|uniref:Uncharacterized protein n=2 Tax=Ceratocystis TaxID=5157 RepID=A0A0F8B4G6_CERFI|nr:hypothetical protein CFO_g2450 [Ceratocystis platani]PHH55730.1 hypothetical protein CFIMG_008511RA00001 [Ceratocystis fimbriata CBS 114723]
MSSYINTTTSGYAIIGVLTVLTLFLMSKKQQPAATPMVARVASTGPTAGASKAKKQRSKAYSTKAAAAVPAEPTLKPVVTSKDSTGTTKDEISNNEFARQMAGLKEGTSLAAKATAPKSKKKSKAKKSKATQETDVDDEVTAPSTSTGRDADDDQSPATSPDVKPTDSTGVADMLEKSGAAPSVLRLTDTATAPAKPVKAAKAEAPVETKKQRQNRKKAEAAKALRAETEKERQVQLEAQRRTARIAEGRPAKDGSQFAAQQKAWTEASPAVTAAPSAMLDTFEAPVAAPAVKAEKSAPIALSEEELIEMAKEDSSEWNTVNKKAKKVKKAAPVEEAQPEPVETKTSSPAANVSAPISKPVANVSKPTVLKSFGSFTALSADEKLPEESEWDV